MNDMTVDRPILTTAATRAMIDNAISKAQELGVAVNIAILDAGLELLAFFRMQDAHAGAMSIAKDKAWTSAGFGGQSTRSIGARLANMSELTRAAILATPRYTCLTGGLPIRVEGVLIGAIGVSGAMPDEDEGCAKAALRAIGAEIPD